ncbi:histo-blood group ABO system transferase 2-like isoform 1-T3 [Discoglossus pictus]
MLPKQYLIGVIAVIVICVIGFWLQNPRQYFRSYVELQTEVGDIFEHKLQEKAIELAHCERKLLINSHENRRTAALQVLTPWLAPIIWNGTFNIDVLNKQFHGKQIGLFVFAVKKYIQFLLPFLESAERHFMVGHTVKYYVFTDKVAEVKKPELANNRILYLHGVEADQRWQDVSMRRMQVLSTLTSGQLTKEVDYLVCADVDMIFNDHVGVEMLGDLVATVHPGFFLSEPEQFPYERRPISAAAIPMGHGDFYYMAAFYGGTVEQIHNLTTACQNGITADKKIYVEAAWQEESHLNKYLVYNKPTKVLSPEYIWDNTLPNGDLVKMRRFLAVPKNHTEIRN